MIQLSNCRTTPQVFFNEQHIGGAHETIALLEQYETQDKTGEGPLKRLQTEVLEKSSPTDSRFRRSKRSSSIDQALNNTTINGNSTLDVVEENQEGETMTVNTNATAANILHGGGDFHTNKISPTSIPIEDDRIDIHPVGSVTVLTITRELLRCLPRFNHVHNGITYKHCFSGKEAMQALLKDSTSSTNSIHYSKFTTQEEILEYARLLQQYKFIHDVTTDESSYQPFSPKRYYRLQPLHTPQIMNTFRLYTKDTGLDQKFPDPNPLATLSNLIRQMTDAILASYKSNHNQSSSSSPGLLKSSLTNRKSLRLSLSPRLSLTPKFQSKSQNGNFLKLPSSPSSPSSSSSFSSSSSHNNNNNNNSTYNYDAIRHTKEFQSFEESICQLQLMDLSYMEVRSKVAFFLNLYNLMVRHALIRFHPKSVTPAFFRSIQYRLGNNYLLSLDDIHHGILRNNSDHPLTGERCFAPDDPRNVLRLPGRDTRIHFCLNSGKGNCDEVHEFHGEAIDEELRVQAENYCNKDKNIRLEENTNTLILPRFMKKYVVDFATDGLLEQIPRRIIRYLRNEKRERLHKMMKAAKEHPEESPLHIVFDGEGRENGFRGGGGGGGSSSSTRELASDVLSQSQSQSSSLGSTSRKKIISITPDHPIRRRFSKGDRGDEISLLKLKSFLMAKGRAEGDGEDGVVGIDGSGRTFIFNGRSTTSSSKQNHILRRRGRRTRRDKWQVFSNSEEEEVGRGTDCSTSGRVGSLVSNQHSPRQGGVVPGNLPPMFYPNPNPNPSSLGSTSRKKVRTSKTKIMCSTLRTYSFSSSSSSSHYMRVPSSSSNSSYHHLHHPHYRPTTCLKDHKYYTRSSYSSSFLKRRQRRRNFLLKLKSFLMAKGRAEGDGEDGVVGIDGSGRTFIFNGRSTTSSSKQKHILRRRGRRTRRDKWQVFSNSEEEEVGRGTDCSTSGRVGSLVSNQHSPRQGGHTDKHTTNGPRYVLSHHGNLHSSSEGRNHYDKDDEDEAGEGQEKEQNARHAFSAPVHTIEFNSIPEQDSDTDSETDPAKDKSHLLSDTPSPNIMQKEKESITNIFSTENKNTNSNIAKSNTFETSQLTPSTCKDSDGSKSYSSSHDEEEEELCEDLKIPIVSYDENENVIDVGNIVQHVGNDNDNHNLRDNVQTMEDTNSSNSCSKNNDENNLSLESKTDIISIVSDNEDEEAHHIFEMNDFTDLSFGSQDEEDKVLQAKHNLDLDLSYDSTISCNNLGPVSPSIQSLRSPIKT
eukprot:CAMPEP_0184872558 /NCGR_PEP_ID=MMETSP0580-20130426/41357_1 /TAXON_ID=1118495 /ORGANISM="Dactyliosolen fragilissimus" /LENGTH=1256 /DNA_ID=CAMNT_0027375375 /DNA_START=163 /DNA_END=3931 /DNA_ORIENTATION=-